MKAPRNNALRPDIVRDRTKVRGALGAEFARRKAQGGPVSRRCEDCRQIIADDGGGHLVWCPFTGEAEDFARAPDLRGPDGSWEAGS